MLIMQDFLRFFGHGFCHQIPARSLESGGLVFSVCARDTGIYLGFFFALIAAFLVYAKGRSKPAELPPVPYIVVLVLFIVPMAFDGLSSYLGLRPTTNTIRYVTGFLTGAAAGSIITPLLFGLRRDANPQQKVFSRPLEVAFHLALTFALGAAFFFGYPYLGALSPFIGVAAFLTIVVCVNLILLSLNKRFTPRHTARHWLLILALALVCALVEITLFGVAREIVVQTVLGGHEIYEFLS
ncbi:MAG: DUF2085 domain-containing protein [Coriobacteriales bacterium]|jgi:uncharacterized membrane protein|nr:DUF2085 domain-containing protein [Coriobacteriales bacterium]